MPAKFDRYLGPMIETNRGSDECEIFFLSLSLGFCSILLLLFFFL